MAAGIGSRFGKGVKQLAPLGPNGEVIMEYSIYDALEAGFNKVVFIIRKDIEEEFRQMIGDKMAEFTEVAYVFQDPDDLPDGFTRPEGRTKPWGTGQAVLAARSAISEPFAVINADDYYGKEAYVKVHDYLIQEHPRQNPLSVCMAGFRLGNTLSENGCVTRGICRTENGCLTGVEETSNIYKTEAGAEVRYEDGTVRSLDPQTLVSMNMWGLTPEFLEILEDGFVEFLRHLGEESLKKEYLLPILIDQLIKDGRAQVAVLETGDTWFGVTYQEDREAVHRAFCELAAKGVYPEKLFARKQYLSF